MWKAEAVQVVEEGAGVVHRLLLRMREQKTLLPTALGEEQARVWVELKREQQQVYPEELGPLAEAATWVSVSRHLI